MEILKLENINYSYESRFTALRNISLTISKGERIAVLGSNGAGKSTFFLCCNGVLLPDSGRISLNGRVLTNSKNDVTLLRKSVGLVFQEPDSQIIAGTVEGEVSFGVLNLGISDTDAAMRVSDALVKMRLTGYEKRAPHYLSGGEKKRVTIADILAMEPDIILLDEPTASLDPENVLALERTLDELNSTGIAVVISTHDVEFAYRFAERVVVFSAGEIIADGTACDVFSNGEVLTRANLQKPILLEASELVIEVMGNGIRADIKPRTPTEFREFLEQLACKQKTG